MLSLYNSILLWSMKLKHLLLEFEKVKTKGVKNSYLLSDLKDLTVVEK